MRSGLITDGRWRQRKGVKGSSQLEPRWEGGTNSQVASTTSIPAPPICAAVVRQDVGISYKTDWPTWRVVLHVDFCKLALLRQCCEMMKGAHDFPAHTINQSPRVITLSPVRVSVATVPIDISIEYNMTERHVGGQPLSPSLLPPE
jgi:hypothetical protein